MTDEDKTEFSDQMTAFGIAYGQPVDKAIRQVYWQVLNDLSLEAFKRAGEIALRTLKWFPKPAELRELAEGPNRITAAMQWAHVRRAMDTLDIYGSPDFGPLVNAVIHALGGWKVLCEKTLLQLDFARKDFERIYEDFEGKDLSRLRTDGHVGEFGRPPTWCALEGTPKPPLQIESAEQKAVSSHVKELADLKSNGVKPQRDAGGTT